jgi:riboflavin biosynthesis pyrimidine reductase
LRCIVSANGAFDSSHPIFHQAGGAIHGLITRADARPPLAPELQRKITLHQQPLTGFLNTLRTDLEVRHLHCEGGGQLIHALAALDAIDEFYLTLAGHTLFGGLAAPTATAIPAKYLPQAVAFELTHFESLPELGECFLSYRRKR